MSGTTCHDGCGCDQGVTKWELLQKRADRLLRAGTLVFPPGERVAYAFVVPIEVRDDLAEILADIEMSED